jgi:hypothetical protein
MDNAMPQLQNVQQVIALYFEADRTWAKNRYAELFGHASTLDSKSKQASEPEIDEATEVPSKVRSDTDLNWRRGSDPGEWAEAVFIAMLQEIRAAVQPSEDVFNPIVTQWQLKNLPQRIVSADALSQVWDSSLPVVQVIANLQRAFGTRAVSLLCHSLFSFQAFPIPDDISFGKLATILTHLGIDVPNGPELTECEIWWELGEGALRFQERHGLQPWQTWAAIFDLGPRLVSQPVPFPTDRTPRVWIVATHDKLGEFDEIDRHTANDIGDWAINQDARRGDLALMYCVSPRSAIVSVYRVLCDAYRDPFGGWNGYRAEIGHKVALPWITISDMKSDESLRDWVLVRRNFQGLLRFEVPEAVWVRLKELIGTRDSNARTVLDAYVGAAQGVREIRVGDEEWSEAEVEQRIVIPILQSLGWKIGSNLVGQVPMYIKVGSGRPQQVFADFVGYAGALTSRAVLVVEVKRRIASTKARETAAAQAESYALKLRCSRYAVASPEGIWVYELRFPGQSQLLLSVELKPGAGVDCASQLEPIISCSRLTEDREATG